MTQASPPDVVHQECPLCGYTHTSSAPGAVCPECGIVPADALHRLRVDERRSWAWPLASGVIFSVIVVTLSLFSKVTGAVVPIILSAVGLGLTLLLSTTGRELFPCRNEAANRTTMIAWNRAGIFLCVPLLTGACCTLLFPHIYVHLGGVLRPYWTSTPLASHMFFWMRRLVLASAVFSLLAMILTSYLVIGPRVSYRLYPIWLRLLVPQAVLLGLSVLGGLLTFENVPMAMDN